MMLFKIKSSDIYKCYNYLSVLYYLSFQMESQISQVKLKCIGGQQASNVCGNKHCDKISFVCQNMNCNCRLDHKFCWEMNINTLSEMITSRLNLLQPLQKKIQDIFEKAIDKLSEERDNLILKIKHKCSNSPMSSQQSKYLQILKNRGTTQQITCSFVYQLYEASVQKDSFLKKIIELNQRRINEEYEKFDRQIKKFTQTVEDRLNLNMKDRFYFSSSKIIKDLQENNKMLAFFTNINIESAKLIYSASENDFSVEAFHKKCDSIPNTITLCETQFGKKIGGFTPNNWITSLSQSYQSDNLKKSFLFSITQNCKFPIKKNLFQATCNYQNFGPAFGGGHDLIICDRANLNSQSYVNIGSSYLNDDYKYGDKTSQNKFAGAYYFKVKQWEVWQIKFQNEL